MREQIKTLKCHADGGACLGDIALWLTAAASIPSDYVADGRAFQSNLAGVKRFPIGDLLPALVVAPLLTGLVAWIR